jgi:hypothetical protein
LRIDHTYACRMHKANERLSKSQIQAPPIVTNRELQ